MERLKEGERRKEKTGESEEGKGKEKVRRDNL